MKPNPILQGLRQRLGALESRDRRALSAGGWIVALALGFIWIARPAINDFTQARERLDTERDLLRRERALLRDAAALRLRVDQAHHLLATSTARLFTASDPVSAAATLARHATDRATRHRVMVQGSETRPAESVADSLLRLSVDLRAIGDVAGVMAWLADLESGPRLIEVSDIRIAPSESGGASEGDEEVLGVSLRINGYAFGTLPDSVVRVAGTP